MRVKSLILLLMLMAVIILIPLTGCQMQNPKPALAENNDDILVGINYFAGWWKGKADKWYSPRHHPEPRQDWRPKYPERLPLLGQYSTQETMDREIIAAAEHDVDFFAILWYYNDPDKERQHGSRFLDRGLKNFLNSAEAHRMKFFIEFCNHRPFQTPEDRQWAECIDTWVEAMKHPSYLRVDGRLVFKVHGAGQFITDCNMDSKCTKQRLNLLRQKVRDAGLGEMVIGGGNAGLVVPGHWAVDVFDFAADYMQLPELDQKKTDYSYDMLADFINKKCVEHADDSIPFMPYIAAGFNDRPWGNRRPAFSMPTRQQWLGELKRVSSDLNNRRNFGIPKRDGSLQKIFTIYAWNEFGEGGFVAPTKGDGYMKLECIKQLFGAKTN